MKKVLLVLLAAAGSIFTANAQVPIPNNGFEFWEDGGQTPTDWDVIAGSATRQSQVNFTTQQGQYVVKPHSGQYFLRLMTTDSFRGVMQTKFAYDLRPNYLAATIMYTPTSQQQSNFQRYGIYVTLLKAGDTVLSALCYSQQESTIFPFALRSWNISTLYRNTETPDSAVITLVSDIAQVATSGTSLWVDNMGFSISEPVGIVETAKKSLSFNNIAVNVYPKPMSNFTNIDYTITERANVKLVVTDITGREVANLVNETKAAGKHQVKFDRNGLKAGVYIYRVQAGSQMQTGKIIIAD